MKTIETRSLFIFLYFHVRARNRSFPLFVILFLFATRFYRNYAELFASHMEDVFVNIEVGKYITIFLEVLIIEK